MDPLLGRPSGGHAPPPPPLYPSNLSPLAPPFAYSLPSPAQWSLFNAASDHPSSSQLSGIAPAGGDTSYPLPEPEEYRWDRPFGGEGAGRGRKRGGEGSAWLEPSLGVEAPTFQEGKFADGLVPIGNSSGLWHERYVGCFAGRLPIGSDPEWLSDRYPTTEENALGPFNFSRETILAPSSLPKQNSYPELPDSSSDAFMGYPTTACSTSVHAHVLSSRNSPFGEFSMFENGYSMVRPIDTYKTSFGFEDYVSSNPKEINDNQNAGLKEDYDKIRGKNDMKTHTSMPVDTFSLKTSLPPGSELAKGNLIDTFTDVESGLKLKSLNIRNTFISETGPAEPNNSIGTSSQALDQINVSVDSPCWKGDLVSRRSLFSIDETVNINSTVKESYNLDQDQKHLNLGVVSSEIPPSTEQVGSLISNDNKKTSDFSLKGYPVVILPSIQKHLDDVIEAGPRYLLLNSEDKKHWSDACKEQSSGVRNEQNESSEENDREETLLSRRKDIISAIQPITISGAANLETDVRSAIEGNSSDFNSGGVTSFLGNDRELLIKTLQNLSEVLLSPCNGGTNQLKEHDRELLEMAVHNLEAFTLRSKKEIASGIFHASAPEAAGYKDIGSKTDVEKQTDNITTHVAEGKVHACGCCSLSKGGIKESSKINSVAQTFGKVLEKTLFEEEENPQALVYKNLWMEAEAALCSMKYELQLANMKIEMENHRHLTRGKSPQIPDSSSWNSMYDLVKRCTKQEEEGILSGNRTPHRAGAEYNSYRNLNKSPLADANKKDEFDAATLARLRILKSRIDYLEPTTVEHQPHISLIGPCVGAKETIGVPLTEGESNVMLENLPSKLSVSGFTECSKSQPNIVNFSMSKGRDEADIEFRKYIREFIASDLENTAAGESDDGNVEGAAIKPDTPTGQERMSPSVGYGSPTSEWEHVLKEDFTL